MHPVRCTSQVAGCRDIIDMTIDVSRFYISSIKFYIIHSYGSPSFELSDTLGIVKQGLRIRVDPAGNESGPCRKKTDSDPTLE